MREICDSCALAEDAHGEYRDTDKPPQAESGGHEEPPAEKPPMPADAVQSVKQSTDTNSVQPPAKRGGAIARLVLKLCFGNRRLAEIARFAIVGVIATLADFIASGIVLYLFAPSMYTNFTDIFNSEGASVAAQCVSTGVGFVVGVVVNYFLSVFFVFEEKGNSKTAIGFILFVVLSAGGLAINVVGMYLFVDFAGWNYWLIKILLTCVVLVYNYLTRKFIIFRKKEKGE